MGTLFSSKLSARITAEGLDVLEFARKAKIPSPTVYHWIAGGGVRPKNVVKVAKFFNENPYVWLRYAGYDMKEPDSPEQEEELLLSVLRDFPTVRATAVDMARLSPQNQKMIQNLVRNLAEGEDTAQ